MTTTLQNQVLINARALITDRAHWTSGMLACAANGRPVHWHDPSAHRWCAVGAIYRAAFDLVGNQKDRCASVMSWPTTFGHAVGSLGACRT